ncbi:hypothetical protein NIES593_07645 [Hydrococcus rivularis NIES-593]|uniref:Four helix bundle protein n=1 Tax=Hydrococcus rivularis NIES-593 TaxID=1921803 RepID=A0A1U7HLY4_9CYAN|nr:four helix bundle protein [Hydrococcus rivularis]OKH24535.1 hypothetical protein NIES593_07645 [Hydrococcus rivularis NIES-593]
MRKSQSQVDFIHKNAIALKEARETVYWLRLLAATAIIPPEKLVSLQAEAEELTRIIGAIVVNSKNSVFAFFLLTFSLYIC